MEQYLVTIDGGTTNTRLCLWSRAGRCLRQILRPFGIRDCARRGDSTELSTVVRDGVRQLLGEAGLSRERVAAIYASGMITSELGLWEVPRIPAPASLQTLAEHVKSRHFSALDDREVHFIPGVESGKNAGLDQMECRDIMRGEETEAVAVAERYELNGAVLLILPGSHNKFLWMENRSIRRSLTTMSGELLELLTSGSVLGESVGRAFAGAAYDRSYLLKGCDTAMQAGLTRAAFVTRLVGQFAARRPDACASYLLGAVLGADLMALQSDPAFLTVGEMKTVVYGKEDLLGAVCTVLHRGGLQQVRALRPDPDCPAAGYGALLIARQRQEF